MQLANSARKGIVLQIQEFSDLHWMCAQRAALVEMLSGVLRVFGFQSLESKHVFWPGYLGQRKDLSQQIDVCRNKTKKDPSALRITVGEACNFVIPQSHCLKLLDPFSNRVCFVCLNHPEYDIANLNFVFHKHLQVTHSNGRS